MRQWRWHRAGRTLSFQLESGKLSASAELWIDDATANAISVRIVKDWYKSRWVPNWRAPNRFRSPHEWGYEFFKIDGMSGRGPGYCALDVMTKGECDGRVVAVAPDGRH